MIFVKDYRKELEQYVLENEDLLRKFDNSSFLISGAAGMIGSYIIDLLIVAGNLLKIKIIVFAVDKNKDLLDQRFPDSLTLSVRKIVWDVNERFALNEDIDYVIHAASNTSPIDYATMPVATMRTNLVGTDNMIQQAISSSAKRFLFCSSVEAYGMNNGDVEFFDETYSGYVDSNSLRAGYPSAKRASEALLNAYSKEYPSFQFVIGRIGRIFGPTVILGDTKAPTQFIMDAVNGRNIVLKSSGLQEYSYGYVADCAIAILLLLISGIPGEAYNIADPYSTILLKEFALATAQSGGTELVFQQMTDQEACAYSKVSKAKMNIDKLNSLGWEAKCHYKEGITRTVNIIKEIK